MMGNVKRIGNLAEPSANGCTALVCGYTAASGQHYEREKQQDADSLVQTVSNACFSADARDGEDEDECEAAPPESTLQMNRTAARIAPAAARRQDARNQHTAKERI